jgi:hypothetical protein
MKGVYKKSAPPFWPNNGVVSQTPQWQKSNCALARLLAIHHRALGSAIALAVEIRRGIDELTPLMAALCIQTCRFCPEPCCIGNTVWIDFRDLLFLHLLDEPIPACQATSNPNHACPFLSHYGCRLPPRIRPWVCIKYICPTQRAILRRVGRPTAAALLGKIKQIEKKRIVMEAEVVRRIKRRIRTLPSSSLASSG